MRRLACTLALTLFAPSVAQANDKSPIRRARSGGLGFLQLGTHIGPVGGVRSALRAPDGLGAGATSPEFGYTVGGGGRALLWRRLVIGGRGFGTFSPRVGGANGRATFAGGGGGLELGVAAVSRSAWLLIPYVGGGAGGVHMDVANTSTDAIVIADDEAIPPEGTRSYDAGFGYIELGLAAHRLLFWNTGGFAVGVDAGAMVTIASSPWSTDAQTVDGLSRARLSGGFLRLTLGGGGFSFD